MSQTEQVTQPQTPTNLPQIAGNLWWDDVRQGVGFLFIGLAIDESVEHRHLNLFRTAREQIQQFAVIFSLDLVRQRLLAMPVPGP